MLEAAARHLAIPETAASETASRFEEPPCSALPTTVPAVPATAPLTAASATGGAGHGWKKVTKVAAAKATAV